MPARRLNFILIASRKLLISGSPRPPLMTVVKVLAALKVALRGYRKFKRIFSMIAISSSYGLQIAIMGNWKAPKCADGECNSRGLKNLSG